MLYMGNVNRLIFWILIPLLIFSYISFRIIEWQYFDDGGRNKIANYHSVNLSNLNDINCLILGGSNASFGLSAEQMSREDKLNCYNLSLLNEGYSDESYFAFVKSMPINRKKISFIFYSTVYTLADDKLLSERIKNNTDNIDIEGDSRFKLFGVSLASRLASLLEGNYFSAAQPQYPNPKERGDFNFELYENCDAESIKDNWTLATKQDDLKNWIKANVLFIKNLFQNADVYLVLPSILAKNFDLAEFADLSNYLKAEANNLSFIYVEQSMFSNVTFLCDGAFHANEIGRKLRTSELLELFHTE